MASQIQSAQKWKFDVFFNFRQQDLDKNFVANLHKRLKDIGINAFKPDVKSECREQIPTEILEAIDESRTAITIFSKDYTSSRRCLEELTKIMECVDNKGQEFFSVQRWKDALRKADDMEGSGNYFAGNQFSHCLALD
ncbi:hypothetical protein KY285_027472 [Solanum tuberosum]|nr:hypothetical protein KY289_027671 [Solanum tuberosum]KAH0666266.1 hypothetical protein KY285_027472 [Solanum tuberosum]